MVPWHHGAVNGTTESGDRLGGRLSLRRKLGTGAFGTVYEAVDARFGGRVAVKLLARDQPQAIYRFKNEFRSLADVVHPNLVRLYELVAGDALYFTMELVDGVDLLTFVAGPAARLVPPTAEPGAPLALPPRPRRAPARDVDRVRAAFLQLAHGVRAIHDAGKLHCDIKPSNVLVDHEGRVVLLDFGLVANLAGEHDRRRGGMGTPGYMAPEQARGAALTAAADWYAVGVMLHEALTGDLPGGNDDVHDSDLGRLARALLADEPASRPDGAAVVERLGGHVAAESAPRARLFGRASELASLRDARAQVDLGEAVTVHVVGASGLGKSALVETFLDELDPRDLVLRGRCYEQESVPYKALDPIVDALAEHLRRLGPDAEALVPPDAALLGKLFPVLRDTLRAAEPGAEISPQEQRRRAFAALRALLVRVSAKHPLVCFLDDLQWGDVDSAHLLVELLRAPAAPRMLVVMAHRPEEESSFLSAFAERAPFVPTRTVNVRELAPEDATALAAHLLGGDAAARAETIGHEGAGSPLFIQQLASRAPAQATGGLVEVILARVAALDPASRHLVETVALSGQPIEETVAVRAASLAVSDARAATLAVRHLRLVTARATAEGVMLAPVHDRVRQTVVAALARDDARSGHRRIAEALIALSEPDPERLVHHFRGAGDDARTREFAIVAADRADAALAFDRAASFRGLVLELGGDGPDRAELHERHARSLENAGRAIEAADAYERAADALEASSGAGDRVHEQRRKAGELTLRSGRLEQGAQRMQRVLEEVGLTLPRSRARATWLAAGRRARFLLKGTKVRTGPPSSDAARRRLDALWSACTGITQLDHLMGDALALQYLLEVLALGDASRIVRGLGLESVFEAVIGGRFFRGRCERLQREMDRLASEPYDRAWAAQCKGGAAWFRGDWETCVRLCDEAMRLYREECRGVSWEIALCDAYRLPSLASLGQVDRLAEIVPRAYAAARDRGDLFAANTLRLGQQSLVFLAEDLPEEAIAEADAAIAPFPSDAYLGPHYHHLFAVTQAHLYGDRPREAWQGVSASWPKVEGAKLLLAQSLRIEVRHLRSRAALAQAAVSSAERRSLLAVVEKDAAAIAKDDVPAAAPTAALLRAGARAVAGRAHEAVPLLEASVRGFADARMKLFEHAARDRLGALVGGAAGSELEGEAAAFFAARRVRRPDALVRMLAPGLA